MNDMLKEDICENQKIEWELAKGMDEGSKDLLINQKCDHLID